MHIHNDGKKDGIMCNCGKFHKFDGYVYAHMHIELKLTCDCGNNCVLLNNSIIKQTIVHH